jgi:hypothetical protein
MSRLDAHADDQGRARLVSNTVCAVQFIKHST